MSNNNTLIPTAENTQEKEMLSLALSEQGKHLDELISTIFRATTAPVRARLRQFVAGLADGLFWSDIVAVCKLDGHVINAYKRNYPLFSSLVYAAKEAGELARRQRREELAHKHAVEGTERPIFQQGREVGRIREFDHRLLEFLLKADNPAKYRDQVAQVNIQNNTVSQVVTFHRHRPKPAESETEKTDETAKN